MTSNITAAELFHRVAYIACANDAAPATLNKLMHETLVLACAAGLAGTTDAIGSLFSKVDVLCKQRHIGPADYFDIQKMRHDSNSSEPLAREELLQDCRVRHRPARRAHRQDSHDTPATRHKATTRLPLREGCGAQGD